jgi:hypothetical protein
MSREEWLFIGLPSAFILTKLILRRGSSTKALDHLANPENTIGPTLDRILDSGNGPVLDSRPKQAKLPVLRG